MLFLRTVLLLSLMAVLVSGARAQSADSILTKHFEARGGLEKIRSLTSIVMHGRSVSGDFQLPIHFYCMHQKAFKVELEYEGRKYFQTGTTTEGWTFSPNQADSLPHEMTEEELREGQQYFDLQGPLVDYKIKGNTVEHNGLKTINGANYFELKLTKSSGNVVLYYLDNHYQIFQTIERNQDGTENKTSYSDYKKAINGLVFPHTWDYGDSKTQIDTIEINPLLDISAFIIKR